MKGDDAVVKKKNKVLRKKLRGKETVSTRIAAIIASKRRRKAGKRRICEVRFFLFHSFYVLETFFLPIE